MPRTIAIFAPMADATRGHIDFSVRLKTSQRELTLETLYALASGGFHAEQLRPSTLEAETIPAAGYYLTGLLRAAGYSTVLTNRWDAGALAGIARHDPVAVCLSSSMIVDADSLRRIIAAIRIGLPDAFIIVGGVLVWKHYQHHRAVQQRQAVTGESDTWSIFSPAHRGLGADLLVVSPHGSGPLLHALKEMERGRSADFSTIPNLAVPMNDGALFLTGRQTEEVDHDQDVTRWDLVDELPARVPVRTSIGCPFRCRYCDFCHLYPTITLRSRSSLLAEFRMIKRVAGSKPVMIHVTDDNVFINARRVQEVCESLVASGLRGWAGFMRSTSVTPANIGTIKQSGLLVALVGVESGDEAQLERMNKSQRPPEVKRGIELLDREGISVLMTFLVGYPGETAETIRTTAAFINSLDVGTSSSSFQVYPLSIFPSSDLASPEFREKWHITGLIDSWSHYSMNSNEVLAASYQLCRQVPCVPYHHAEESNFFNRSFSPPQRRELFRLRHTLTLQLIDKRPWDEVAATFSRVSEAMGIAATMVGPEFRDELIVPEWES